MNSKPTRAIFLIALGHLTIETCNNYLPVIYPRLIEALKLNYTQVGTIALVASVTVTLPQLLFGYLSDRWRTDRLVTLSVIWIGLTMGLVGFARSYVSLLFIVAMGGLGSALFHPPSAVVASASSGERRGAAMSIFSVSGNLGTALSPLLMTASIGFLGLLGTSVTIPISLLVGLLLYRQLGRLTYLQPSQSDTRRTAVKNGSLLGLALVVSTVMSRSWFQVALMTYLPTWIEGQGRSLAEGGQLLSLLLLAVGAGSLIGGVLSDRIGRWKVLALSTALLAPALWLFLGGLGVFQIALVASIGVLIGSSFPVALVMAQEALPQRAGMASGIVMGLGWLPGGIGASFTGFIADQFSLTVALQMLVVPPIVGSICSLLYGLQDRSTKTDLTTVISRKGKA